MNDVLIPHFKKAFLLSDLQSGLVQSAFYMGYFLLALPAGLVMRRYGYKTAVVAGLVLFGCGALLFYPAAEMRQYGIFLASLFVIASGLALLETSANPLMTVLGDPATAERRLNFAQAFNPLGAISAVVLGREFILSGIEPTAAQFAQMSIQELAAFQAREAQSVQGPYLVIAAVVANSIRGLGELTQPASSLLVMSIIGGAVLTALMGYISDQSSIRAAMWVPAACFGVVAVFGLFDARRAPRTTRPSQITVGIKSS